MSCRDILGNMKIPERADIKEPTKTVDVEDECINCHETIVSTGISHIRYWIHGGEGGSESRPKYNWVHESSGISKCDPAKSEYYAASTKRP